ERLMGSLAEAVGLSAAKLDKMLQQTAQPGKESSPQGKFARADNTGTSMKSGQPSVVRRAITLLLNHPAAADKLDVEKLAGLSRPGIDVLQELIETVQAEPNISAAGLLERWRHDERGRHLGKLAAVEVPDEDEFDPALELSACLDQLALAGRRERIDFLIEKQKLNPLTDDEKLELRQML
ncbi:MAG: hypothetical protein O2907_05055, partial [Proteobacteria bacterium]|nr:hypothetical protein [Pseudomonadota bacterium]